MIKSNGLINTGMIVLSEIDHVEARFERMARHENKRAAYNSPPTEPRTNEDGRSNRNSRAKSLDAGVIDQKDRSEGSFHSLDLSVHAQRAASREKSAVRKNAQFCAQVREAVQTTIDALDSGGNLYGFHVVAVFPSFRGSSKLEVVVQKCLDDAVTTPEGAKTWLDVHNNQIRAGVSTAISRKRTPQLDFVVLPLEATIVDGSGASRP